MDYLSILNQMLSLFCIGVIGYIMYKVKILDDTSTVRFTKLILSITLPAQILTSFMNSRGVISNKTVLYVFGVTLLCYLMPGLLGAAFVFVTRAPKQQKGLYLFMHLFANVGFMGFPVISTIFGDAGMIYAVIFNVVFNVLVYSLGILLIGNSKETTGFQPKLLLNIPFIAALISIILFFTPIQFPSAVMSALDYLGNVTTPVAMLILGCTIASMPVKELFDDWRVYLFAAMRLAVVPLTVMLMLKLIGVKDPLISGVMIILTGMPVATNTTMLAIEYGGDLQLASKGIFFTTILSVITIPLIAMVC
ncbi:MAG: AEC family transporter [Marvinbryantia sp.]|jgi:predicted permease